MFSISEYRDSGETNLQYEVPIHVLYVLCDATEAHLISTPRACIIELSIVLLSSLCI